MARATGLSPATIQRIWKGHGLQPHRVETFELSRDPRFLEKLKDVAGLYLDPKRALKISARSANRKGIVTRLRLALSRA